MALKVTLLHVRMPVLAPGATRPPETVSRPTTPVPQSVPAAATCSGLAGCEPSTCRRPLLATVVPVWVLVPLSTSVPVPVLRGLPEPLITPANTEELLS